MSIYSTKFINEESKKCHSKWLSLLILTCCILLANASLKAEISNLDVSKLCAYEPKLYFKIRISNAYFSMHNLQWTMRFKNIEKNKEYNIQAGVNYSYYKDSDGDNNDGKVGRWLIADITIDFSRYQHLPKGRYQIHVEVVKNESPPNTHIYSEHFDFDCVTPPYLNISPLSREVEATTGSVNFTVSSNVDWQGTSNVPWLLFSKPNASTITASYTENNLLSDRIGILTITGGGITRTVSVQQKAIIPVIDLIPESNYLKPLGGEMSVNVRSNVKWDVLTDQIWLIADKKNDSVFTVSYTENSTYDIRSGNIVVYGAGFEEKKIQVIQDFASPYADILTVPDIHISEAGVSEVKIKSNFTWLPESSEVWLNVSKENDSTLLLIFDANESAYQRTANITLKGFSTTVNTLEVSQKGASAFLNVLQVGGITSDFASDTVNVIVHTNSNWTVTSSSDWLTSFKLNDSTATIILPENTSTSARQTVLSIDNEHFQQYNIPVYQEGKLSTRTNPQKEVEIKIYPNPTQEVMRFEMVKTQGEITFQIMSINGSLLWISEKINVEKGEINISHLNEGFYLLNVTADNIVLKSVPLIIE